MCSRMVLEANRCIGSQKKYSRGIRDRQEVDNDSVTAHWRARWQKVVEAGSRRWEAVEGGKRRAEPVKVDEEGGPS